MYIKGILAGHEYFAEVAEDFIEDEFNLTGLAGIVGFYKVGISNITIVLIYLIYVFVGSFRDDIRC